MRPSLYFWWGLLVLVVVVLGLWLGALQFLGQWLWNVVHVVTRP